MNFFRAIRHRFYVLYKNLFCTFEERTDSTYLTALNTLLNELSISDKRHKKLMELVRDESAITRSEVHINVLNQLQQHLGYVQDFLFDELQKVYENLALLQDTQITQQQKLYVLLQTVSKDIEKMQKSGDTNAESLREILVNLENRLTQALVLKEFDVDMDSFSKYIVDTALDKDWEKSEIKLVAPNLTENWGITNSSMIQQQAEG